MAVYDDQKERVSTGDLQNITGINDKAEAKMQAAAVAGAKQDIAQRENGSSSDTGSDEKSLSKSDVSQAESAAGTQDSLFNEDTSSDRGGFLKGAQSKVKKFAKNKVALAIVAGSSVSVISIILMIIFFLGLFKIPNLAEHITAYQFARVTRDYAKRADNVHRTKMGIASADDGVWSRMKDKYTVSRPGQAQAKAAEKWAQLDKYRPQKTIDNMRRDGQLKFVSEKQGILQRERLKAVTIGNRTVLVENTSLKQRLIPGSQFRADAKFAAEFKPALRASLASNDVGPLVRGVAMRSLRQELGISLIAWNIDKLKGKTAAQARIIIEQENYKQIKGASNPVNPKASSEVKRVAQEAADAEKADVNDPKTLEKIIATPNEPAPGVLNVLRKSFVDSGLKGILDKALGVINPVYAVAAPVCLIYEGSLVNNGSTINEADESSQRAYIQVAAAGSQIKDGYDTNGQAAGAFGAKLGNIEQSIPERRASGLPVDTSQRFSSQSSPIGNFSIADAIFPSPIDTLFNNASEVCPIFTNVWAGVGLGLVNIGGLILSGGSSAVPQATAQVVTQSAIRIVVNRVVARMVATKAFAASFTKSLAINFTAIAGGTFIAKWIVMNQIASAQTSPLASGTSFVDNADAGGNSHASSVERTMLRGAPLAPQEIAMNNMMDSDFRADKVRQQSPFQRYLAISNPDSFANNFGSTIASQVNSSAFSSLVTMAGNIINPSYIATTLVQSLNISKVRAQTTDTFNYGNVQFGFTVQEQQLLDNDITFMSVVENQLILDASQKEAEIASRFGPCFDKTKGIGDLLTEETGEGGDNKYYIVRDTEGNVLANKGLCSQKNLGPNNAEYGDLVFRWRVAGGYDSTLIQLDEQQNPTDSDAPLGGGAATGPTGGGAGVSPDGFNFPLLTTQNALKSHNPPWCTTSQANCHHDYNAADIFAPTGTPVVAARAGKVVTARNTSTSGCSAGSIVVIKGSDGLVYTYLHMGAGTVSVTSGADVTAGQKIGAVGTNANAICTPAHLHFDILPNQYNNRMACRAAACSTFPFINPQPVLVESFNALPQ